MPSFEWDLLSFPPGTAPELGATLVFGKTWIGLKLLLGFCLLDLAVGFFPDSCTHCGGPLDEEHDEDPHA